MSGSLPFGFGMPDDGAGRPAFDMGQLGAMLQHLGRLLESGGDGAVNWDLARDTARQAISGTRSGIGVPDSAWQGNTGAGASRPTWTPS